VVVSGDAIVMRQCLAAKCYEQDEKQTLRHKGD
jgi:hypothetical protein